jgi:hypothetical protein
MESYEYIVVRNSYRGDRRFQSLLETLQGQGEKGWRLVHVQETTVQVNTGGATEEAINVVLYFERKRP